MIVVLLLVLNYSLTGAWLKFNARQILVLLCQNNQ
jgi:hypothetical protein